MTRTCSRRSSDRQRGFTLIELLVVLVIIGLLAGLASLSVGGNLHRQARAESERLYQLVRYASDEAMLQGDEYGLVLEDENYAFVRFDAGAQAWVPAEAKQFAAHPLPGSVSIDLRLEERVELPRREDAAGATTREDGGEAQRAPDVLMLSSGEITPFRLEFRSGEGSDAAGIISSDGSGNLEWQ